MQEIGMRDIRDKNLADIVNKNKVVKVTHYNDTAFYMVSEVHYLKLTSTPPKVKQK